MIDTILILTLGLLIYTVYVMVSRHRQVSTVDAGTCSAAEAEDLADHTRQVLGESAYATMTERVAEIMRRHAKDRCIAVSLTSGASEGNGADELHHLLPGDPVWLKPSEEDGLDTVGVYSGGYKVGELMLLDADAALEVLRNGTVTGSYVCEQNCYEYYEKVSLKLIIFFQAAPETSPAPVVEQELPQSLIDAPYKVTYDGGPVPITVFQN